MRCPNLRDDVQLGATLDAHRVKETHKTDAPEESEQPLSHFLLRALPTQPALDETSVDLTVQPNHA